MKAQRGNARRRELLRLIRERTRWTSFEFICAGCGDFQPATPVYSDWECGNCEYSGRVSPGLCEEA